MLRNQFFKMASLLLCLSPDWVAAQEMVRDDFSAYRPGSAAAPQWKTATGYWLAEKGHFCERSGAFDAGAFRSEPIAGSFELTVRFRILGDYRGAGLFFGSESHQSAAFAHMVRLDGENALIGYFERGNYQATQVVPLPGAIMDSSWHQMRLQVLQSQALYRFWIDDSAVGKPEKLRFHSGFAGVQNSGSHACFDDFVLESLADSNAVAPMNWPISLASSQNRELWVGSQFERAVKKLDRKGKVLATIAAKAPAEAFAPVAMATVPDGGVAVLDSAGRRLHRYDSIGGYVATIGGDWQRPVDVVVLADGRVVVSDIGAHKLLAYDAKWDAYKTAAKASAVVLAAHDSLICYYDESSARFHFLRTNDFSELSSFDAPAGQIRGLAMNSTALFVAVDDRIEKYSLAGDSGAVMSLEMMGGIFPQKIAIDGENVMIADFTASRIVVADTNLAAPVLRSSFDKQNRLTVRWSAAKTEQANAQLIYADTSIWAEKPIWRDGQVEAKFAALPHSRFYRVRYQPILPTIPADNNHFAEAVLMTPPPTGTMQFMELQCAAVIFANVIDSSKVQPGWPQMPRLMESEIERIRAQIEDGRQFFWLNSSMRLHLAIRTIVVDSLFERSSLFSNEWYYPPNEKRLEQVLQKNDVRPDELQGVFFIAAIRDFDEAKQQWQLRGRGGAFTNGLSANGKYGVSWWEATRAGHDAGNNWLVVHEFHHQLDELFTLDGMPEYWFNHFAPIAGTAAKFGEHFDGNAFLLRNWPYEKWFALSQAKLRLAEDADGDGIPDQDARLPMDEARLGSDPAKKDSDGDSADDFAEMAFSNWITEGQGENANTSSCWPDLAKADTDEDGLADGKDPHPLFPWSGEITHLQNGFSIFGELNDDQLSAQAEAAWSADTLFFRFQAAPSQQLRLLLDANNNGWFSGRDNLVFQLNTSDSLTNSVQVFQAAAPDRWPYMDEHLARQVSYSWRRLASGGYQLAIAKNDKLGLWLERGERLGVDLSLSVTADLKRISFHEPNRFFELVLK